MIEPIQVDKLEKPSLVLALALVKFASLPVQAFRDIITELHSDIRAEYPGLEEVKSQSIELAINNLGEASSQEIKQKKTEESSFIFSSSNSSWVIVVSPVSLVVCTKAYVSFDDLSDRVRRILGILGKDNANGIKHTSNIGLRYINRIDMDEKTGFDEAINRGFLQPKIDGFKGMGGSDMMNIYQSENSWCLLRTSLKVQGLDIPDGLLFIANKMKLGKEPVVNVFASIDIDANTMSHDYEEFSLENVAGRLVELHDSAKKAFGSVLTAREIKRRS